MLQVCHVVCVCLLRLVVKFASRSERSGSSTPAKIEPPARGTRRGVTSVLVCRRLPYCAPLKGALLLFRISAGDPAAPRNGTPLASSFMRHGGGSSAATWRSLFSHDRVRHVFPRDQGGTCPCDHAGAGDGLFFSAEPNLIHRLDSPGKPGDAAAERAGGLEAPSPRVELVRAQTRAPSLTELSGAAQSGGVGGKVSVCGREAVPCVWVGVCACVCLHSCEREAKEACACSPVPVRLRRHRQALKCLAVIEKCSH